MRTSITLVRPILVGLLLIGSMGCSRAFWDRSPRVGGNVQPAPYTPAPQAYPPSPYAAAPYAGQAPSTLPPPEVRSVPPAPQAYAPQAYAPPSFAPPSYAPPTNVPALSSGSQTAEEQQVFDEVNHIRSSLGLLPFRYAPCLYRAAQDHSREQEQHGYMGHGSPDPNRRTLMQRMQLAGYQAAMYGEVVAWGYRDARSVVEGWMNSAEHRAILVDRDLSEAAFAKVGAYWTGNFGAPRAAPPRAASPRASAPPSSLRSAPPRQQAPAPSYAAPAPRAAPTPRVQQYFPPQPSPRPAPVIRPPTRGG